MSIENLTAEFQKFLQDNHIPPDSGDASDLLASGKLTETEASYIRDFIKRWEQAVTGNADHWHAERSTAGDAWHIWDKTPTRVATIHRAGPSAVKDAYLLAAAPALRDALDRLLTWVENNVAYGLPRALAEDCGQALEDAKAPQ